jgi:hypothetical protein
MRLPTALIDSVALISYQTKDFYQRVRGEAMDGSEHALDIMDFSGEQVDGTLIPVLRLYPDYE